MSSMLKKTGGLSFKPKPKIGRRPGAGPSKPPDSSASASTTRATTTEPPSQASTPVASHPSAPAVVDPAENAVHDRNTPPIATDSQAPPPPESHVETPAVRPAPEYATSSPPPPHPPSQPVIQTPVPQPTNEIAHDSVLCQESPQPAAAVSSDDTQSTPSVGIEYDAPSTTATSSHPSAATPATTSELPGVEEEEEVVVPTSAPTSAPAPAPAPASAPASASAPAIAPPSPAPVSDAVAAASGASETGPPPEPSAPKKRTARRRKSTVTDSVANAGEGEADSAPKKKRQRTKSTTRAATEAGKEASAEPKKPTRRRKREPTPENAEELTVDHATMTVGELTKDLGIGKRFKHADEIEQRAREARAKHRIRKLERQKRKLGLLPPDDDDLESQPDTSENGESRGAAMAQLGASMESGGGQGVGYDVVDGQIVVHAASLVVDRHNRDMFNLETVEENDFTNLVNSASFAKRVQTPGNWTDEDTDKFYRLLGMFGTDFETISRLFPGKNRRAIKLKFNKEERLCPNRVNAAMMVRGQKKVIIDIEEYKASQRQWQPKDMILEEHAKLAEEYEREVTRLRDERRAAGLIDDDDDRKRNASTNATGSGGGNGNGDIEVIEENADALGQGGQGIDVGTGAQQEGIQA
ncbi:hypothetical protein F5B17DRAFT_428140 [Nemania serpens]|nr:hypothetical protein F5B17DRAFT_428140 [Nemania serpens]